MLDDVAHLRIDVAGRPHHRERGVDQAPDLGRVLPPALRERGVRQPLLDRNNVLHSQNTIPIQPRWQQQRSPAPAFHCQLLAGNSGAANEFAANAVGSGGGLEAFDDEGALDLAGRGGAGEGVHDGEAAGVFEGRQPALAERPERVEIGRGGAGPDDDHRGDDLAPLRVGHPDDRDLGDGRDARRAPPRPRAVQPSRRRSG